jgi:hypothetical protein
VNTQTQTTTLAGTLPDLTELFRVAALYTSTDKPALSSCLIEPAVEHTTATATDSYAAIIYTTQLVSGTGPTIHLPARDIAKHLTAAVKTIGKREAAHATATLTATEQTWEIQVHHKEALAVWNSGTHQQPHTWPNTAPLFTTPTEPSTTPYRIATEQLDRLTRTADYITHTHTSPTKPNHYTTNSNHGHAHIVIMPTRMN